MSASASATPLHTATRKTDEELIPPSPPQLDGNDKEDNSRSRSTSPSSIPSLSFNILSSAPTPADIRAKDLEERFSNFHCVRRTKQVTALLTLIRDVTTPRTEFVFFTNRLTRMVIEETLNHLSTGHSNCTVVTPLGVEYEGVAFDARLCGVSLVRSGEAMETALRAVAKTVKIGKIIIQRPGMNNMRAENVLVGGGEMDIEDGERPLMYFRLPEDIDSRSVLLLDPILATGGTARVATQLLLDEGVTEDRIVLTTLLASPEGIEAYCSAFPKARVVTVEVEEALDENGMVVPGLGSFGDRYFGTED